MSSRYGLRYNGFLEVAEKWRKEKKNIIYFCFRLSYCFHLLFIYFFHMIYMFSNLITLLFEFVLLMSDPSSNIGFICE